MERKVTVKDITSALDRAGLLASVTGGCSEDAVIGNITFNSKEAAQGTLFVVKGAGFREQYLCDAIEKGAACYVREVGGDPAGGAYGIFVKDIRKAMPVIAEAFYGKLSEHLFLTGITGTKGKSTVTYYLRYILDEYMAASGGKRSAVCSGIDNYDGVIDAKSHLTTPEIFELYSHMDNAVKSGITHMTMEVSSQALKYDRVTGLSFAAGAFLNIGEDHISDIEHPTFDDYLESKLRLFGLCKKACYNLDCDEQERIREASAACPYVIGFSAKDESAAVYGYDIRSEEGRVSFRARVRGVEGCEDYDEEFSLGTFGIINVENALAAIAVSALLGVPEEHVKTGLAKAHVPGRMEMIRSADGKRIAIVDFAHNELSFLKFYETIREEFPEKKILTVFGATGSKGTTRRVGMGRAAGRYSDYSVITEDDPGFEDVTEICEQIAGYIKEEGGHCEIVTDRPAALRRAIDLMDDDTILFAAGRGNETKMLRGKTSPDIPSDAEVIREYML